MAFPALLLSQSVSLRLRFGQLIFSLRETLRFLSGLKESRNSYTPIDKLLELCNIILGNYLLWLGGITFCTREGRGMEQSHEDKMATGAHGIVVSSGVGDPGSR
jgi:hypothetical protein